MDKVPKRRLYQLGIRHFQSPTVFKYDINLSDNSPVLYKFWFNVKLPEDDLKRIETCRSISGFYVKYSCICWHYLSIDLKKPSAPDSRLLDSSVKYQPSVSVVTVAFARCNTSTYIYISTYIVHL